MKKLALAAAVLVALLTPLALSFRSAPLAEPAPYLGPSPPASPPLGMQILRLPTGVIHRNAAVAYRGGSPLDARDFAMTAVLVKHPAGDLLIDTGLGRNADAHLRMMPLLFRALSDVERGRPAVEQLDAAGYDRRALRGIILTHAHWDHVSGVEDFPGTPVLVPAEERRFIGHATMITAVARSLVGVRWEEYGFTGGPYLGFPRSHDVHGDGSVVIVPCPGHTPGSVVVFVTAPPARRFAFVGDLAWQVEGITLREERPWLVRTFVDGEPSGVREGLLRMAALHARFPDLVLAPAHDARGFAQLPTP